MVNRYHNLSVSFAADADNALNQRALALYDSPLIAEHLHDRPVNICSKLHRHRRPPYQNLAGNRADILNCSCHGTARHRVEDTPQRLMLGERLAGLDRIAF